MITYQEVAAIKAFSKDDFVEVFKDTFRKLAFGKSEYWNVSADELTVALQDALCYHLKGIMIDAAEDLIG